MFRNFLEMRCCLGRLPYIGTLPKAEFSELFTNSWNNYLHAFGSSIEFYFFSLKNKEMGIVNLSQIELYLCIECRNLTVKKINKL